MTVAKQKLSNKLHFLTEIYVLLMHTTKYYHEQLKKLTNIQNIFS